MNSDKLGMSYGKANNKLKKLLLYEFVFKLGLDNCYRCGEKIKKVEEFSIEHTKSWINSKNPIRVFFDLEKIAFSHSVCNSRNKEASNWYAQRITCNNGHKLIGKNVYLRNNKWRICKVCRREWIKKYREMPS